LILVDADACSRRRGKHGINAMKKMLAVFSERETEMEFFKIDGERYLTLASDDSIDLI
jgi:hypothetical protein